MPQTYCINMKEGNGVTNAVVNEDESITVSMTKQKYDEQLFEMKSDLGKTIAELTKGTTFPLVKRIVNNDNLPEIRITVDLESFSSMDSFIVLGLGIQAYFYRIFTGQSEIVTIAYIDEASGNNEDSYIFPEYME